MNFQSKTRHEIEAEQLLPDGVYDFQVVKGEEKVSKKGNPYMKVTLKVFAPNGGTPFVFDNLMESFMWKLLNFCEATGLMAEYNAGCLEAHMLEGVCGKVKIGREEQAGYPARNVAQDYIIPSKGNAETPTMSGKMKPANVPKEESYHTDLAEDDVPF